MVVNFTYIYIKYLVLIYINKMSGFTYICIYEISGVDIYMVVNFTYIYIYICIYKSFKISGVNFQQRTFSLFFNGISTFMGYLMPNPSFYKNSTI